jgi:hypothetical protein
MSGIRVTLASQVLHQFLATASLIHGYLLVWLSASPEGLLHIKYEWEVTYPGAYTLLTQGNTPHKGLLSLVALSEPWRAIISDSP